MFYHSQICLALKLTLADFLSPIFDKSYLHAFKKPQTRSVRTSENQTCLIFPRQDPILSWLVGIRPSLADFLLAIKNRHSPDKKSASM